MLEKTRSIRFGFIGSKFRIVLVNHPRSPVLFYLRIRNDPSTKKSAKYRAFVNRRTMHSSKQTKDRSSRKSGTPRKGMRRRGGHSNSPKLGLSQQTSCSRFSSFFRALNFLVFLFLCFFYFFFFPLLSCGARGLRNTTSPESHTRLDGVIMPRSDWRGSWNRGCKRG